MIGNKGNERQVKGVCDFPNSLLTIHNVERKVLDSAEPK